MHGDRLEDTMRLTTRGMKRVESDGASGELQKKIQESYGSEGTVESPFRQGIQYLAEHMARQADGLRSLHVINDKAARRQKALPLLLRRKELINGVHAALRTESFTNEERSQLLWFYDISSAFINQLSKELGLFEVQYLVSGKEGSIMANSTTAELQQNLAQLIITGARTAASSEGGAHLASRLEEEAFALFHTMSVRALGLQAGQHVYKVVENGVYGAAAAYMMYSNAKFNRFGKSFKVFFPSPYMDAIEQTDLLLIDEAGLTSDVRQEIATAIQTSFGSNKHAIDEMSAEAKRHVYKVQVKCRDGGTSAMTNAEKADQARFVSARCNVKGFDNSDYLVLTVDRAHSIIEHARKGIA